MSEPKPSRLPQIAIGSALLAVAVSVIAAIVVLVRDDESAPRVAPVIDHNVAVADIAQLRDKVELVVDGGMPRGLRVTDPAYAKTLGLDDKDIITALLGRKLTREQDLVDVMSRARLLHATTLYAELDRGGTAKLLRWQLDGDFYDAPRARTSAALGTTPGTSSIPSTPPYMPGTGTPGTGTPGTPGTSTHGTWPDPTLTNPYADPDPVDMLLDSIQAIDDTHVRIPKKTFEAMLANPTAYTKSARIVPSVKNGDPDGYRLFAIRPRSVLARVGLVNGDTVHAINGAALIDVDDLVSLLVDAKNKVRVFRFDITRRGKPVELEIEITP